jgi:hypothetical protein
MRRGQTLLAKWTANSHGAVESGSYFSRRLVEQWQWVENSSIIESITRAERSSGC